ncbi:hypothetical protein D6851_13475 [Altericroceibacterium spongiae]|uniref:DUF3784 domain-containing protein n=1 Tax=Altericroceibacterium spongiae TaxID=2320269 RepID=A0A420EE95_9SPHN|nr:hypothetical protein [Altericroceibacterium spongiae]RKF19029.1 hypothetical protein D6851_13475 [Altericroceibacterium spongiae]
MAILVIFLLGIGNFALHKAVLESRHPMIWQRQWLTEKLGENFSLFVEFLVLLCALLLVANGFAGWIWAYIGYSAVNGLAGWLILSHRI